MLNSSAVSSPLLQDKRTNRKAAGRSGSNVEQQQVINMSTTAMAVLSQALLGSAAG
jgi:hypothetical protein